MEKRSLLQEENYNTQYGSTEPSAPSYVEVNSSVSNVQINEASEFPSPHALSERVIPTATCRVCKFSIDISGKGDQFVVQCENCHEATPIKLAPVGKKYVRCPCNCLLICNSSSQKISCPRPNCKRIISMAPTAFPRNNDSPGMGQVSCPHCQGVFMINTTVIVNVMKCMYCRRRVAFSSRYIKFRTSFYTAITLLFLISAICTVSSTGDGVREKPALYITLYIVLFGLFLMSLTRSIFFCSIKPLHMEAFTDSA